MGRIQVRPIPTKKGEVSYKKMNNDFESILDEMSEKLTGGPLLMDITYEHIPAASSVDTLCFKVSGDASDVLEGEFDDDE